MWFQSHPSLWPGSVVSALSGLTELSLRRSWYGPDAFSLHQLELSELAELAKLTGLARLDLSAQADSLEPPPLLDHVGAQLALFPALRTLLLSENLLVGRVFEDLAPLVDLEDLSLVANSIETVPAAVSWLTALTALDLTYNPLAEFPTNLLSLPCLRRAVLYFSPLAIPDGLQLPFDVILERTPPY